MLGLALDRPELVDQDPSSVPTADDVAISKAPDAVHVLRAIGQEQYAVQYAYEVIRHNFQNPDAHKAFILALSPFPNEPELEEPVRVGTGVAVCYVEQGDSTPHWIIVEDSPEPASQFAEPELSPDHGICKGMIGKKVGDTFVLAKGIQDRVATITQIQNKYVHRFQDCTGQWQVRFPELPYLQAVRIAKQTGKSNEAESDFSAILKSLDQRYEHVKRIQGIYKENLTPLYIFGKPFGKNAFEAIRHLALSCDVSVKCCVGTIEEREEAAKSFRSCNTVVLDMSAISTLFLLDRLDILKSLVVDLVVSKGTMSVLRNMIANEARGYCGKSGVMFKTDTGYSMVESTAVQHDKYIKLLRHLVEVLENNCKIKSCKTLAAMKPGNRETLIEVFGQYGAETILLSAVPGAVLWTDDQVQAMLARSKYGVARVWTQFVIGVRAESGMVNPEVYLDASAKLLGYGYDFSVADPAIIRCAGAIAEWKVDGWPLLQALSTFSDESVDLRQVLELAAGFLRLLYQDSILPQTKSNITVKILENVAKRMGGIEAIQSLHRALPRVFGVNVVGCADATKTIEAWLKSVNNRLFM